jgi:flagellar hook-associated protein 2
MASIGLQQISGLASGLDTASIISSLMLIDKQPQVRIQQKIVTEQARQQALRDVLSQLKDLTTSYQGLTDVGTWADTQTVASSDDAHLSATRTSGAAPGAYTIDVTTLARANQFSGSLPVGVTSVAADDTLHITTSAGTTDVQVSAGDTLDVVAGKINGTTGSPVYANVLNGQLVLSNKQTGTAAKLTAVTTGGTSGLSFAETQTAQDASFRIDGVTHTSGSNVVTDAMAGITLTLKGMTTGASITIGNPAPDTKTIEDKLNAFVTKYNSTLDFMLGKLDEDPVANPQTDADRAVGVLHGDSGLQGLVNSLRNAFSDLVTGRPGTMQSLAQAGLSTGAATGSGGLNSDAIDGKLTVDTTKFESQLNTNFDNVKALFTNATGSYASEGLAQRLSDILTPWTASSLSNGLLNNRIDGETTTITSLQNQSKDWDVRLQTKQEMLQAQFTAMEVALSKAQSQGQWLDGQISQLG